MSYIKYKISYIHQMYIEYVHWHKIWHICPLMPIYMYMSINYIFSFPRGEGNKSLEVFGCYVEGDDVDDGVFFTCSLVLLFSLFSNLSWYKKSRYESIIIVHWNQIYVHTKLNIFLPTSNSHSVHPLQRLADNQE